MIQENLEGEELILEPPVVAGGATRAEGESDADPAVAPDNEDGSDRDPENLLPSRLESLGLSAAEEPHVVDSAAGAGAEDRGVLPLPEGRLRALLEAVLFASSEPLALRVLADLFGVGVHDVREVAEDLRLEYAEQGRAFRLEDVAGGLQVLTQPQFDPWIRRLRQKERDGRLSSAALETLALIAYKQPIAKADVESIRGVQSSPVLKSLLDRGLVQVVGREDSLGRPLLYGTTRRFLESFGLPSLRELPQPDPPGAPTAPAVAAPGGLEKATESTEAG